MYLYLFFSKLFLFSICFCEILLILFLAFDIIKMINSECAGVFYEKMIILLSVVFCLVLSGCGNVDSGSSSGLKYHVKCADAVDVELSLSSNTDYSLFVQDGGDRFYVYRSKAEVPTVQDGSLDTSSDIDVTKVGNDYKIELGESLLNMRDLYGNIE